MYKNKDDFIVLDTRNDYESAAGKFKNAITPKIKTFRQFPKVAEMLKGKYVNIFSMGVENPISTDIVEAKMSDPEFRYQTLSLSTRGGGEERIEGKEKINAFLKKCRY